MTPAATNWSNTMSSRRPKKTKERPRHRAAYPGSAQTAPSLRPGNLVTGKHPTAKGLLCGTFVVSTVWSCGHVALRMPGTLFFEIELAESLKLVREDLFFTVPLLDGKKGAYHYTAGEWGGEPRRPAGAPKPPPSTLAGRVSTFNREQR